VTGLKPQIEEIVQGRMDLFSSCPRTSFLMAMERHPHDMFFKIPPILVSDAVKDKLYSHTKVPIRSEIQFVDNPATPLAAQRS
jgi:hypothetical protein